MTATEGRIRYGDADAAKLRQLKIGMIGVGVGGTEMLPPMDAMPELDLMAGADINPLTRERFKQRYPNARVYDSAEAMCQDPDLEAVWISTPNRFHAEHTILAANHGKHVVVEKPMALSLQQAEQMIEAADKNGVKLLAGHTRSFTLPIRAMRRVIQTGELGALRSMTVLAYTDWMIRPRTADELDPNQGGGVVYRQGPHQIDSIRVIGGGLLRSVRGFYGQWMPQRPIPGYYSAFMQFEDGTPVTLTHNGYGYFMGGELVPWGHGRQRYTPEERGAIRKQMQTGTRPEDEHKQAIRIGGEQERTVFRPAENARRDPWVPEDLGFLLVSCDRGDMRHSGNGIYVYGDDGQREVDLTPDRYMGGAGQRRAELEELYGAVVQGKPLWHDGRWGMATLEACLAILESSREQKEIRLSHQVALPAEYDAEFTF